MSENKEKYAQNIFHLINFICALFSEVYKLWQLLLCAQKKTGVFYLLCVVQVATIQLSSFAKNSQEFFLPLSPKCWN